jgi:hypothetical protein
LVITADQGFTNEQKRKAGKKSDSENGPPPEIGINDWKSNREWTSSFIDPFLSGQAI